MSEDILLSHREIWKQKPILKLLYTEWYQDMVSQMIPGLTLEVGGGSGNLKEFSPDVICSDIVALPWLDCVADAQSMPFADTSFSNIVLFDVLHHIENPALFFTEAQRVLKNNGRVIIMEPYVSKASWFVYNYLHPEPVDFNQNPLEIISPDKNREPFDSNQAISRILFETMYKDFFEKFPRFRLIDKKYLSFFVYPLSGGFDHPSLLPLSLGRFLLKFEKFLAPLGRFFAFRVLIVLELTN